MIVYRCDGCGKDMKPGELRYSVKIDVHAAYDTLEIGLGDLLRNHRAEMLALIERMKHKDPQKIEEAIYKLIKLDLCPACQKSYIRAPLRFHPETAAATEDEFDVDGFLRSLGIPEEPGDTG